MLTRREFVDCVTGQTRSSLGWDYKYKAAFDALPDFARSSSALFPFSIRHLTILATLWPSQLLLENPVNVAPLKNKPRVVSGLYCLPSIILISNKQPLINKNLQSVVPVRQSLLRNVEGVINVMKRLKTGTQTETTKRTMKRKLNIVTTRVTPWYTDSLIFLNLYYLTSRKVYIPCSTI